MAFYCPCGQRFDYPSQQCLLCLHYPSVYVEPVIVRDAHSFHAMNDNRESRPPYSPISYHLASPPHSPNSIRSTPPPCSPLPASQAMTPATTINHEDTRVPNRSFSTMTAVKKSKSKSGKLWAILKVLRKFRNKKASTVTKVQTTSESRKFSFEESMFGVNTNPIRRKSLPVGLIELPTTENSKTFELWAPPY
jgi:hypothetical protein